MARALDPRSREARLEAIRRQNDADARRARTIGTVAAVVGGLLVLAVVVAVVLSLRGEDDVAAGAEVTYPDGTVLTVPDDPASGGFPIGGDGVEQAEAAAVRVVVFEDYRCPACQAFEAESGALLAELAAADDVAVVRRPVAILDHLTGEDRYSTRSAAAAACVGGTGDGEALDAFSAALFAEQPTEDAGTGPADERLVELAATAGAGTDAVAGCITDGTYVPWAAATTESAGEQLDRLATPTVLVDGEVVAGSEGGYPSGAELQAAVDAARTEG